MHHVARLLLAGLMLAVPSLLRAADAPAGMYKVTIAGSPRVVWLLKLESKDGKWSATATNAKGAPPATVDKVKVGKGMLEFTLTIAEEGNFVFEGRQPEKKDAKMFGTLSDRGGAVIPIQLVPTALTGFDPFEVSRETLTKSTDDLEITQAAIACLSQAAQKKAKPDEAKSWAERAVKSAEVYGPKWKKSVVVQIAEALANQDGFNGLALDYAEQAEKSIDPSVDGPAMQKRMLTLLADALDKAGRKEDAKTVRERGDKISFVTVKPYPGRKGKSDRVVLTELFTCSQQPNCIASDNAAAALLSTYKPSEVVLLVYHLNVPNNPDPLSCTEALTRAKFYETSRTIPAVFFNGVKGPDGGGGTAESQANYEQYTAELKDRLEKPAKAKLTASATRKGNKIDIKANVADLAETGAAVHLRVVLVEEAVAFSGGNKVGRHVQVVRHFVNGTAGTALKGKSSTESYTVDLDAVAKNLKAYYDRINEATPFPTKERPAELKKLRVVVFVQNDDTNEVLNAAQVDVKGE